MRSMVRTAVLVMGLAGSTAALAAAQTHRGEQSIEVLRAPGPWPRGSTSRSEPLDASPPAGGSLERLSPAVYYLSSRIRMFRNATQSP